LLLLLSLEKERKQVQLQDNSPVLTKKTSDDDSKSYHPPQVKVGSHQHQGKSLSYKLLSLSLLESLRKESRKGQILIPFSRLRKKERKQDI
jgi:hypothetical protein